MELDRNDLLRSAEFAGAAMSARSSSDVAALVRRLRHALDDVHLWSIAAGGAIEWRDPDHVGPSHHDGHDGQGTGTLAVSASTSIGVVHLVAHRRQRPFGETDRAVLELASPYLVAAVVASDDRAAHRPDVAAELAMSGRTADTDQDREGAPLTTREVQILASVASGATNKEVAAALGISPRTVQKHLEHVYEKLGLHRRTAAAGWWSNHLAAG